MNLYALSVNHRANPLGINSDEQPYFGWKLKSEKPNTMQAAYRLRIYADDSSLPQNGKTISTVGGWKQHATLLFAVPIFCNRKHSTAGQ